MNSGQLSKEIRTLHWREYRNLIDAAVEKQIVIPEEDLIWAILEIPEHYKISSLVHYSNHVKAISEKAVKSIVNKIKEVSSQSYRKHLSDLVSTLKTTA